MLPAPTGVNGSDGYTSYVYDKGKRVIIPQPKYTLGDDPDLKDLAKDVGKRVKIGDYEKFRDELNKEIKERLKARDPKLNARFKLKEGKIYFKAGVYKGQQLHYAHIIGQAVGEKAGADSALKTWVWNLQAVGAGFHLSGKEGNLGHHEEWNTGYGRDLFEEAMEGIRRAGRDARVEQESYRISTPVSGPKILSFPAAAPSVPKLKGVPANTQENPQVLTYPPAQAADTTNPGPSSEAKVPDPLPGYPANVPARPTVLKHSDQPDGTRFPWWLVWGVPRAVAQGAARGAARAAGFLVVPFDLTKFMGGGGA